MADLIDRQTAIDAILEVVGAGSVRELYEHTQDHELDDMWSGGIVAAIDVLIAVPAVQPEQKTQHSAEDATYDCISRQAAIAEFSCCELTPDGGIDANYAIEFLENLPAAQPELIEKVAYIRGFEQGRTQGMIDAQGGKK